MKITLQILFTEKKCFVHVMTNIFFSMTVIINNVADADISHISELHKFNQMLKKSISGITFLNVQSFTIPTYVF